MALTILPGNYIRTGSIPPLALTGGVVSSSVQINTGSFTGSFTGSLIGTASWTSNSISASFATSASWAPVISVASTFPFTGSATITGSLNVTGSLNITGILRQEEVIEKVNVTASAPPATYNIDLTSGSIFFRSASATANWTMNFRGNATLTLNDMVAPNESITATILTLTTATPYSASAYQIDGTSITPRWEGGISASANPGSLDVHQFTIIKLASASYQVLGSITRYS